MANLAFLCANYNLTCMRRIVLCVATVGLANAVGCGSHAPDQDVASSATSAPSTWIDAVVLGTPQDPNRGIGVEGAVFAAGELIQLRVDASGAPANAQITVDWLDAHGDALGSEMRVTRIGKSVMTFDAPRALPPGHYALRMLIDGRLAQRRDFEIRADGAAP